MKLIKLLLGLVGFFVVLIFIFNLFGGQVLASTLSSVLGTPVQVKSLRLNPLEQQVGIYGLKIDNVEGYQESQLASIPEIYVDLDLVQILKQEIRIEEIRLNIEHLTVERGTDKKFNLVELKPLKEMTENALGGGEPSTGEPPTNEPEEESKKAPLKLKTRIDEAVLTVGQVHYVDYSKGAEPQVRDFMLGVNEARLSEIGTTQKLVQEVVLLIMKKVGLKALIPDFDKFSATMGAKMEEMKEGFGNLMNKMKESWSN